MVLAAFFIIAAARSDVFFEIKKNFSIFSDVFTEVSLRYVDEVEPGSLMNTAINAMLEMLDPYTVLINEGENQEIDIITTGKYAGVGLEIGLQRGEMVVIAPIEGYSAERKGVKAGDIILELNGIAIKDLNEKAIESQLFGEPGSSVIIKVKRYGIENPLEFTLERERIDVKSVPYAGFINKEKGWVYIQLTQFSQQCADEVRSALLELKNESEITGIILDLRNNPGGLVNEAVSILDLFLPAGVEVVTIKGRLKDTNQNFYTNVPALFPDTKLIVLQNNGSASASEIVAGALQDLDRAIIMGERSYGKGLVQTIRPIAYNNALKITSSRYYIPSGRSIQSLKYSHLERNEVENIPDSLRSIFKTKAGRTVYDGIGIEPDVAMNDREFALLEVALLKDSYYFYFANEYVAKNDTITADLVKSKVYDSFKTYLKEQNFSYESEADYNLSQLKQSSNWAKEDLKMMESLEKAINKQKEQQFDSLKAYIQFQLFREISERYLTNEQFYPEMLIRDKYVNQAKQLLENPAKYQSYLSVSN